MNETEDAQGVEVPEGAKEAVSKPYRGGDLVEYQGLTWKVIPCNVYDDKYVSIHRWNRILVSVPVEELKHAEDEQ